MNLKLLKIARFFHLINKKNYNEKRQIEIVKRSPLFDAKWYLAQNQDVKAQKIGAAEHYVKYGWKEGRNPSPCFNTNDYINLYLDVKNKLINPLYHYEMFGKKERRCIISEKIRYINTRYEKKEYKKIKEGIIDIETIKKIISSKDIKVISFDIFDTLLLRPAINPTDIFYLIDKKVKSLYNLDFIKYRMDAESKLQNNLASLDEIYDFIRREYNLSFQQTELLKREELLCEKQVLTKRDDIYELYLYAIKLGKRIIATSDMYLSSSFLREVLKKNGYDKISRIYVSNECKARKDTGELYPYIKDKEKTSNILHIGDNYNSDYQKCIEANITAVYYPSIKDIIFADKSIYNDNVWIKNVSPDPMCRILIGFTLNEYFKNLKKVKNQPAFFADFESAIRLSIAPVVFYIANSIATNEEIQSNYNQILFASRDGYLPKIGYDIIAKYKKIKPSKYVYAGRRAYYSSQFDTFIDYLHSVDMIEKHIFTIENILRGYNFDENIIRNILSHISEDEKKLDYSKDKQKIISVLCRFKKSINDYYKRHRESSKRYYKSIISNSEKEIIFDCGYSGSVSQALSNITGKVFDKIYLWETEKNKQLDKKYGSKTFLLMHENKLFVSQHLIYEEIFSPLEGGCLGFENGKPIIEKCDYSQKMVEEYACIKKEVSNYINNVCKMFGSYLQYLNVSDTFALQRMLVCSVQSSPYNEILLLENIKHPDTAFMPEVQSLAYKVQKYLSWNNPFAQTGFENPNNKIEAPIILLDNNFKIGIHIHLYYIDLGYEFLDYLKDFPQKFDLIITICDENKVNIVKNIFSNTIPNLEKLIVKVVENRGRDIAPWLIGTREEQKDYDLFCHVQSKVSPHIPWGEEWRKYLLNNLLKKDSVENILNIFTSYSNIGCIFPNFYSQLRMSIVIAKGHLLGEDGEDNIICELIRRLGYKYDISQRSLLFSGGTMMWYRTKALKPLFDLNLDIEEFPPEPIGVGGTIAHAIERLPALVCKLNGYEVKEYTRYED